VSFWKRSSLSSFPARYFTLSPLPIGDVAGNRRCAHDIATRIMNGRNGERDRDGGAVFPASPGFVVVSPLTGADPVHDLVHLAGKARRYQE
jgi:hypothetical protein